MTLAESTSAWCSVKFTDILNVQGGSQPPKSQFISEPQDSYVRLLQIRDFGNKPVPTFIPDTTKLKKCTKDDVLIGRYGASLGRICTGMEGAYNVALAKVITPPDVSTVFTKYYLLSELFQQPLRLLSRSAQNGFNKDDLATFGFVLPPLAEQKQIATKLDELLAQVEIIKTRLDAAPIILNHFRQSVLAAAVSGRLTEEWRDTQKLEWPIFKLQDVANIIDPQPSHRTPKEVKGGVPYIGIGDLNPDGSINFERARKVSTDVLQEHKTRYQLNKGDFIFGKIGTLGKATVLPIDMEYTLSANVILIQPLDDHVIPEFLMYFLLSPKTMAEVVRQSSSTSQAAFGIKKMRAFESKIPDIKEQTEIVRRVEQLFTFSDQIEQRVKDAQARVNYLTQSILARAFRGELTAEWREKNPDLISGENSAEALLERIKSERNVATPKKHTRNAKA